MSLNIIRKYFYLSLEQRNSLLILGCGLENSCAISPCRGREGTPFLIPAGAGARARGDGRPRRSGRMSRPARPHLRHSSLDVRSPDAHGYETPRRVTRPPPPWGRAEASYPDGTP